MLLFCARISNSYIHTHKTIIRLCKRRTHTKKPAHLVLQHSAQTILTILHTIVVVYCVLFAYEYAYVIYGGRPPADANALISYCWIFDTQVDDAAAATTPRRERVVDGFQRVDGPTTDRPMCVCVCGAGVSTAEYLYMKSTYIKYTSVYTIACEVVCSKRETLCAARLAHSARGWNTTALKMGVYVHVCVYVCMCVVHA